MLMKKALSLIWVLMSVMFAMAQSVDVTIIDNINSYEGDAPFVYSKADGKTYALNNLGKYELYGTLEVVPSLKPAGTAGEIEFIETTYDMKPVPYINSTIIPKSNTRIVAEIEITQNTVRDWEALFGARKGWWENNAFAVFCRANKDGAWNAGVYSRSFDTGSVEQTGTTVIPQFTRLTVDASDKTVSFTPQGATEPAAVITADVPDEAVAADCVNELFIFDLNTSGVENGLQRDNSSSYYKLYSLKIYEGDDLIADFVPYMNKNGLAGLKDKVNGIERYSELEGVNFAVAPQDKPVTTYLGKLVCYNNEVYKWNGEAFEKVGNRIEEPMNNAAIGDLTQWTSPNMSVFEGSIVHEGTSNTIAHYEGQGGYEPLHLTVDTEEGQLYNFSFKFSCGEWWSWTSNERMKAFVFENPNFGDTNNGYNTGDGNTLAALELPTGVTTNLPVSLDFVATGAQSELVYQFGYVDDGDKGFNFKFNDVVVSKVTYDVEYTEMNPYKNLVNDLIVEAEAIDPITEALKAQLDHALAAAKAVAESDDIEVLQGAANTLQEAIDKIKAIDANNVKALKNTITIGKAIGIDTTDAEDFFMTGTENSQLNNALSNLRVARKQAVAERQKNVFQGNDVTEGDFYLYNVGQKRFFTTGSDWGTHAALGMPGTLVTLEAAETEGEFFINTGLNKPENDRNYLNWRGYGDQGRETTFKFNKLSNGNFQILHGEEYVKYNPNASVDTNNGDWTTVGTQETNVSEDDLDAQWILVTKADRDALLEEATEQNPQDASYYISNPNFLQRFTLEAWNWTNAGVWGRNDNHSDVAAESWNSADCDISTTVKGLKPGLYDIGVQGFYRDGNHSKQASVITEEGKAPVQYAILYSGDAEALLPNIVSEADNAPGLGNNTSVGEYPDGIIQACQFFQNGLYKTTLRVEVGEDGELTFGVKKNMADNGEDWVVVDNFRLTYFGPAAPVVVEPEITFNPEDGATVEYGSEIEVSYDETMTLYYTTDGSDPTTSETVKSAFGNPEIVTVDTEESFTIKAYVENPQNNDIRSEVYTATYTVTGGPVVVGVPTFNPQPGTVDFGTRVTILPGENGQSVTWTTDGSDPRVFGDTGAKGYVVIEKETTIKAFSQSEEGVMSEVVEVTYTVAEPAPEPWVTFDPEVGTEVEVGDEITIDFDGENFQCWVTTDGSDPATSMEAINLFPGETVTVAGEGEFVVKVVLENNKTDEKTDYEAVYPIKKAVVAWVTFDPESGTEVEEGDEIAIDFDGDNFQCWVTTDGSDPATSVDAINLFPGEAIIVAGEGEFVVKVVLENNKTDEQTAFQAVYPIKVSDVVIATEANGYGTFCYDKDLDFSGSDAHAYICAVVGNDIFLTEITEVPAFTGILVKADDLSNSVTVPVMEGAIPVNGVNEFVGVVEDTNVEAGTVSVLSLLDGVEGFYKFLGTVIPANKAYIPRVALNGGAGFSFVFDDADGISNIIADAILQGKAYNLNGQRVKESYRGIVIIDGKKFVKK